MKFWSYWGREDTKHNSKGFTHFYSPPKQCQWYVKYFLHNALEEIFWEYPSTNSKDSQSFNYTEEISECKDMKKVFILHITTSCLCCPLILNGVCQYVIVHVAKHEEKLTEKQMEWGDRRRGRAEEGWKKRVFGDGREGDYFNRSMDKVGNRSTREADERKISNSLSHLNAQRSFFLVWSWSADRAHKPPIGVKLMPSSSGLLAMCLILINTRTTDATCMGQIPTVSVGVCLILPR